MRGAPGMLAAAFLLLAALPQPGAGDADADLREKILRRLTGQVALHLEELAIEVEGGRVKVGGSVASLAEARRLERIVSSVSGVKEVASSVAVRPSAEPEPVLAGKVRQQIERRPKFRRAGIEVAVEGSVVTLAGSVDRALDRLEAEEAASEVAGIARVINQIEVRLARSVDEASVRKRVTAILANPLTFGAIRDLEVEVEGGRVTLKGSVARELDRREAERLALTITGVESVRNDLVVRP